MTRPFVKFGKTRRTTLVVGLTVLVFCVLALLQYRWVDQLSDFELQQRERALETSAEGLVRSLDREFGDIQSAFRPPRSSRQEREDLFEDYRDWLRNSDFPELITDVFWIEEGELRGRTRDQFLLIRFNLEQERLESADWDRGLGGLGDQLALSYDGSGRSRNRAARALTGTFLPGGSLALVEAEGDRNLNGWIIVLLDPRAFAERFLPSLVRDHFGPEDQREYDIWITTGSDTPDGGLIYASNPDASPGDRTLADLSRELDDNDSPNWVVAANHRSGSLEASVGPYRLRNLSLSLGAVILLGASFVLLLVITRRAQALAQRQIEFVAGVSHELRTPIAGICSLSQNLADGVVDSADQAQRYGDSINREGRRLSNMVEGVLRFSAMRSGYHRHQPQWIDLHLLIDDELEALRESSVNGSRLTSEIEADLPSFFGDEQALKSMLRNLVANSLKFSRGGREVRVIVARVNRRGRNEILLRVADDGPGIDKADLPHLFEPFYRGRLAREAQVSGSGLGLSLVKDVVDAHGGQIEVDSSAESGTVFSVYLPVDRSGSDHRDE